MRRCLYILVGLLLVSADSLSSGANGRSRRDSIQGSDNVSPSPRRAPTSRASLRWVIQSIERNDGNQGSPASMELLRALKTLERARTQKQVAQAGQIISSLTSREAPSLFVQERLIKATAIAGLISLSLSLFDDLIATGLLPSEIAYTALCEGLRKTRRVAELNQLLYRLGNATKDPISVVALNTYLASLCDRNTKGSHQSLSMDNIGQLEKARQWLRPGFSYNVLHVHPDHTSYNTVLHAAASTRNRVMVNELWDEMKEVGISPDRYTLNAVVKAIQCEGAEFDHEVLDVLKKMKQNPFTQPDRYTIDLVLLPVLRTDGIEGVVELISEFTESLHSARLGVLDVAFSAFLNTLVKAEEEEAAQDVFDAFILPQLTDPEKDRGIANVRHFNILLDGWRKALQRRKNPSEIQDIRNEAIDLHFKMREAGIRSDEYTLSTLMGLVTSSRTIVEILQSEVVEGTVDVTPIVLRSILSACGRVQDPSSACWIFQLFALERADSKTWNALLGALAECAAVDSTQLIDTASSAACIDLAKDFTVAGQEANDEFFSVMVVGKTCPNAALALLRTMRDQGGRNSRVPRPNSQSFCLAAAALQHRHSSESAVAMELFTDASAARIPIDGRLINAVLRCFGEDIQAALQAWKGSIRNACIAAERSSSTSSTKNRFAAYQGLLHVCGRALRPDVALRVVYAMRKEGVEPNEMALQCYQGGKRKRLADVDEDQAKQQKAVAFATQFEQLLGVECTKYSTKDKRREGDKRVRIII